MSQEGNRSESAEQSSGVKVTAGGNVTTGDHVTGDKITHNYYGPPPSHSPENESPAPGVSPFKGLEYFNEADAALFFGREALTAKLVGHLRHISLNFLAVVGASGSGKSSLVRAGLVPALKRGEPLADGALPPEGSTHWPIHVITPTSHPLEALATSLTRNSESVTATATLIDDLARDPRSLHLYVRKILSGHPTRAPSPIGDLPMGEGRGGGRLVIVVDQFEELFTLCHNESERQAFVDNLLTAVALETDGPTIVVLTLRADFYAHCAQFADLREALAKQQEYIGPMSADELRRAIEEPAKRNNWNLEEGLVDLLLREVGNEPGALPLLSHALLETWKRRSEHRLTLKGYTDSGGVRGAIAKTAEAVYQQLTPEQQTIARSIFLRLTELGEGTQDTRRRAALTELTQRPEDKAAFETVLKTLADARLIMTGEETAEVAHEALIREWPTLRRWLDDDREGLKIHRRLTEMSQEWDKRKRDPSELYRGARLSATFEWAEDQAGELNVLEREFLAASRTLEVSELEAANKRAAQLRRRSLFLTWALSVTGVFLLVAISAVGFAFQQSRIAFSRQLAAQAQARLNDDPQVAVLLALEARRYSQTDEAEEVLAKAPYIYPSLWMTLHGHTGAAWNVAWSPDGKQLASGSYDQTIILWDVASGQPRATLKGYSSPIWSVAWSPDGKQLASGASDQTIIIWDVASGQPQATLKRHTSVVTSLAWSPDGKQLASGSDDDTVILWDVMSGQPQTTLRGHTEDVTSVVWSPDGKQLASGSDDDTIILWDVASGQPQRTLKGHTSDVWRVVWSPDGKQLASGASDQTIILWDMTSGQSQTILKGHTGAVTSVAWSPDGKQLASGSGDETIILWDVASGQPQMTLQGHTSYVWSVAWSPDGKQLASGSDDQMIILWDVVSGQPQTTLQGHTGDVTSVAWSPDGRQLASGSYDRTIIIWDVVSGQAQMTLKGHTGPVYSVAWSPDGKQLASGSNDQTIIWDVASGQAQAALKGHTDYVTSVAWSPDGKQLASGSYDTTIIVWDVASGQAQATLQGHTGSVSSVSWSPDGKQLASGAIDTSIIVWDVANGQPQTTLQGHTLPASSVAWSPDGKQLASGSYDTTIIVWDVASGQAQATLQGHTSSVSSVSWSPDGKQLASGSNDTTIIVWDVASGQPQVTLDGHTSYVWSVAWSPDGKQLASGSRDNTVILLKTLFIRPPCKLISRNLTRDEWQRYMPWYVLYHKTCQQWPEEE